jgi:hypothetical protein
MKSESLLERIARIAEAGTIYKQGRRVLAEGNPDAILPAMLQEIDETILARKLTFHNDADDSIAVIAKGRRLWQICDISPKSLIPKGADLVSVNLSGDDDKAMKALAKLMQNFAKNSKLLSVTIADTESESDYSAMGLPVPMLRNLWNIAAAPTGSGNSLQAFVESITDDILASAVMAEGDMIFSSGSDKQIKLLTGLIKDQIPAIAAEFEKLKSEDEPKSLIALNRDSKYFIICARMENMASLIVCKPDKFPNIVSTWQQLI